MATVTIEDLAAELAALGQRGDHSDLAAAQRMIAICPRLFTQLCLEAGYDERKVTAMTRKFRDAGRRSPPWKPTSSRVPGRPQDGADGNRRLRWLFDTDHKFYADERTATLVEVRYYLQALSMDDAPEVENDELADAFIWLTGHPVAPGNYRDPIQLVPIGFPWVLEEPRRIQSGHLVPLDRGGRHAPDNAFLMLARSNQLQGNQTLDELLELMRSIVQGHEKTGPQEPTEQI